MQELKQFFKSLWQGTGTRLTGILSLPLTIAAFYLPTSTQKAVLGTLALVAYGATCYRIWLGEYERRLAAERKIVDGRPKIVFLSNVCSDIRPAFVEATNIGGRAARDISLSAPAGNRFSCSFRLIPLLTPMQSLQMEVLPADSGLIVSPQLAFSGLLSYLTEQRDLTQQGDPILLELMVDFTDVNDERYRDPVYVTARFLPTFSFNFWSQPTKQP